MAGGNDGSRIEASYINILDDSHRKTFDTAITNVLGLDVAEKTFAQILDGLPTVDAAGSVPRDHLVMQLQHREICDGFLAKTRGLKKQFDPVTPVFEPRVVQGFQKCEAATKEFHLRLIELVVVACHQIAASLYEQDEGAHKHQLQRDWYAKVEDEQKSGRRERGIYPRPVAFSHVAYWNPELCDRGEADIAGYWAESRIFGGVVVFDRGELENECKSMWLHGERSSPYTLYPPTDKQFDALVEFLLSDPDDNEQFRAACPLPMHATADNRPRWDPWEALSKYHIFRDKKALVMPTGRRLGCTSFRSVDWPEIHDRQMIRELTRRKENGESYDAGELAAAQARVKLITSTSPFSHPHPNWIQHG